jgi:glucose/arabinose dehydrogenase
MGLRPLLFAVVAVIALVGWQSAPNGATAAPPADSYSIQAMVPASYLGNAGSNAIEFAMIPGNPNEAIVAQQTGYIWRIALDGSFAPALWGDIHDEITFDQGEQGLLSVAFAPDFVTSHRVYIYYTPGSPTPTVLARFSATPTDLDESSEEQLLNIEEFAANHNGGHIVFDSHGLLYLSLGDGGGGGDPNEKGQALNTLLGKILRINVSGATGYTIPSDNPFIDGVGPQRDEIFAYGFRNPWRFTIDTANDDVWVGDVGQAGWEEVDRVVKGGNYGWDCYEGNHVYESTGCGPASNYIFPRAEYDHSFGQAVTGGAVYRGTVMPELAGWYVYSDFYSGHVWAVNPADTSSPIHLADLSINVASFTQLPDGELAIVSYGGGIYRLVRSDADADGVVAGSDNCPSWPNAGQAQPSWPVLNDDADCDGFAAGWEGAIGTNPNQQCAATLAQDDEPDAWPVDFNDNRVVNGQDVARFQPAYNKPVSAGPFGGVPGQRFDFNANGLINGQDVARFSPFYNKGCS